MDPYSASSPVPALGSVSAQPLDTPARPAQVALAAAANLLGMQPSDVRSALEAGQSLAALATSKGTGQDALVNGLAAALQQAHPGMGSDQALRLATEIATRTPAADGGHRAHGGRGHHRHGSPALLGAASQALGMTADQLTTALAKGQSLADIASAAGVTQQQLVTSLAGALQSSDQTLSSTQATRIASRFVGASETTGWRVDVQA